MHGYRGVVVSKKEKWKVKLLQGGDECYSAPSQWGRVLDFDVALLATAQAGQLGYQKYPSMHKYAQVHAQYRVRECVRIL